MKVSGNVRIPDRPQDVRHHVGGTKVDRVVLEKLNRVGNQTALGHTKEIVQWFQSGPSFPWIQSALATVLFEDVGGGYLFASLPGHGDLVGIRKMADPSGFLVDGQSPNRKVIVVDQSCL